MASSSVIRSVRAPHRTYSRRIAAVGAGITTETATRLRLAMNRGTLDTLAAGRPGFLFMCSAPFDVFGVPEREARYQPRATDVVLKAVAASRRRHRERSDAAASHA